MARKRQINTIRTDYLENWIGFYRAHGLNWKADALIKVAVDVSAPIDAERVDEAQRLHTPYREPERISTA